MSRLRSLGKVSKPIIHNLSPEYYLEMINQRLCPLAHLTYSKQLQHKQEVMMKSLKKITEKVSRFKTNIVPDSQGLPCLLNEIRPSPKIYHYRNKDEFTIWPGPDGNPKTLGFFLQEPSKYKNAFIVEPDKLIITKESHKKLAKQFQTYLREVSPYGVCTDFRKGGNWRRFVVRSNEKGEHMIIAIMHPMTLTEEEIDQEKSRLIDYFSPLSESLAIKSAYFQVWSKFLFQTQFAQFFILFLKHLGMSWRSLFS